MEKGNSFVREKKGKAGFHVAGANTVSGKGDVRNAAVSFLQHLFAEGKKKT
ncbi:hypothetical protein QCN27_01895 [Cereibacter sp. SYSU M97828]|nr:hypothetical protein [Cereibacter flavus]